MLLGEREYWNLQARSIQVFTTNSLIVSVLITCAKLVGLKSPVRVLMVTFFRSMLARTDVTRTGQSLHGHISERRGARRIFINTIVP